MERAIRGYHEDEAGDWVAELSCGHGQHVRHRPPFQLRPWATTPEGRASRVGAPLDCPWCDRAEPPDGLSPTRSSPVWDEETMPQALRRAHRLGERTWGRVVVSEGRLAFTMASDPPLEVELGAGMSQAIPPSVEHEVRPLGHARFRVEFLALPGAASASGNDDDAAAQVAVEAAESPVTPSDDDGGGDSACWAHLCCPECGAVLDGGPHRAGCPSATA
ncbi:MAG TPA: DUF3565 domain-containing protein [Acidimicrobiales bacterium]|nr:DUF3565 domain-containing protein [Acidimicrobiales bacterium]